MAAAFEAKGSAAAATSSSADAAAGGVATVDRGSQGLQAAPTRRPLSNQERFFAARAEATGGSQQITTLVTLEPPPEPSAVCDAAGVLQQLHPELRAAIVKASNDVFFDCWAGGAVEVRVYEGTAEEAMHKELSIPLKPEVCGWRLAVCGPHLLLTYHHSFLDGRGSMAVLEDLLEVLAGREAEVPTGGGGGLAPMFGEDPAQPWQPPALEPRLVLVPECLELHPERPVPPSQRRQRWIWQQLPRCATERLLGRCREAGTTAQGALGAAAALAFSSVFGGARGVKVFLGVDCRKALGRAPRSLASCAQSLTLVVPSDRPFWQVAQLHRQELTERLALREHVGHHPQRAALVNYQAVVAGIEAEMRQTDINRPLFQISNRGSYQLATPTHCATAVHFVQMGAPDPRHALFFLNACTVGGSLCLSLCYDSPAVSARRASDLAAAMLGELQAAIGAESPCRSLPEATTPTSSRVTWRLVDDKLPRDEGRGMRCVPQMLPSLAVARQLARDNEHCVGFAMMKRTLAFYFKQKHTGYDTNTPLVHRPGFQWHCILERAVPPQLEEDSSDAEGHAHAD